MVEIPVIPKNDFGWGCAFTRLGECILEVTYDDVSEEYDEEYELVEVTAWTPQESVTYHDVRLGAPSGAACGYVTRNVYIKGEQVGTIECHNLWWELGWLLLGL